MNCPSCGAPLSLEGDQESLTCDYCKSIYLPEQDDEGVRLLGQAEGVSCPICADSVDARHPWPAAHPYLHALPRHADSDGQFPGAD
jgi:endogenous inhibitor of DNA gyrase (YacG/DUF329 family)